MRLLLGGLEYIPVCLDLRPQRRLDLRVPGATTVFSNRLVDVVQSSFFLDRNEFALLSLLTDVSTQPGLVCTNLRARDSSFSGSGKSVVE